MLNFHNRIFADQAQRGSFEGQQQIDQAHSQQNMSPIETHNRRIIRQLKLYSPQSSLMMIAILLMFFICMLTDIKRGWYNISTISGQTLIKYGANVNLLVNAGQKWRLFTAMFLHSGIIHLFMNSTSFFMYLIPVQKRSTQSKQSKLVYSSVLLLGGMMGNMLTDVIANSQNKNQSGVGASTSICSVIGFDFCYRILRINGEPLKIRRILISLSYLFIISLMPGVDFFGHFGSLFGGFFIGIAALGYQYGGKAYTQSYGNQKSGMKGRIISIIGISITLIYFSLLAILLFIRK